MAGDHDAYDRFDSGSWTTVSWRAEDTNHEDTSMT